MKKREQGILSVEASIVLTLMLMAILFLFGFGRVYRAQSLVSHATLQSADAVALESYLRETALQSDVSDVVYLASQLSDSTAINAEGLESLRSADLPKIAKEKFVAAISNSEADADKKLKSLGIKDGLAGIDFTECKMDLQNDDVIVAIRYEIEMQFPIFGFDVIEATKAAKAKTFGEILFEISTKPNNPGWGSTGGDSKVTHGSNVEITAKPNYGYKFVGWDDGSTDNPRKVTVTDAKKYTAIFEKDKFGINTSTRINYNSSYAGIQHTAYGSVSGAGIYSYLDVATLRATPAANYVFVGWDINGDGAVDKTAPEIAITVDKIYSVTAVFKPAMKTVTVKSNNGNYGYARVSQGGVQGASITAEYGSNVSLTAGTNNSTMYSFANWNDSNTQASRTVTVTGDTTYTANFKQNICTVTFIVDGNTYHKTTVIIGSSINGSNSVTGSSMPSNPRKIGRVFNGWNGFSGTTKVYSDKTVKCSWGECTKHEWGNCGIDHTMTNNVYLSKHKKTHKTITFRCQVCVICGVFAEGNCTCTNGCAGLDRTKLAKVHLCTTDVCATAGYCVPGGKCSKVYYVHDVIGYP